METLSHKNSFLKLNLIFSLFLFLFLPFSLVHAQAANNQPLSGELPEQKIESDPQWKTVSCKGFSGDTCYTNSTTNQTADCAVVASLDLSSGSDVCTITNKDGSAVNQVVNPTTNVSETTATDAKGNVTSVAAAPAVQSCSLNPSTWGDCLIGWVAIIALLAVEFIGFFLSLIGAFFNWVVVITVFQFGLYFGNSQGLLTAWGILRDIGNIVLIFGFIFMGLLMILDLNPASTRKSIPTLIIVALLLNFSLFGAEAVIDISNVLSAAIYNQAGQGSLCNPGSGSPSNNQPCSTNVGISSEILQAAGLSNLFDTASQSSGLISGVSNVLSTSFSDAVKSFAAGNNTQKLIAFIGLAIFMGITCFVLLFGAILLVIRAIVLVLVLILSPVGLVALAIPPLNSQWTRWSKTLISQAFYAPVYLLLILVSLKIMLSLQRTFANGSSATTILGVFTSGKSDYGSAILFFALVTGFMIASQMVAKSMGAIGADFASKSAAYATRKTFMAPVRLGAYGAQFGYRQTAGRVFNGSSKLYASTIGKMRNAGGITGALAGGFDNMFGAGIEGGLNKARDASLPGTKGYSDKKKADEERKKHTTHVAHEAENKKAIQEGLKMGASAEEREKMEMAMQKMSNEEIGKTLSELRLSNEQMNVAAKSLSTDQMKAIAGNNNLDSDFKHRLTAARFSTEGLNNEEIDKMIKAMKEDELALAGQIAPEFAKAVLARVDAATGSSLIDDGILTNLSKKSSLTNTMQKQFNDARRISKARNIINNDGNREQLSRIARAMNGKQFADFKANELLEDEVVDALNAEKLSAIVTKDGAINTEEREALMERIQARYQHFLDNPPADQQERERKQKEFESMDRYLAGQNPSRQWDGRRIRGRDNQPISRARQQQGPQAQQP